MCKEERRKKKEDRRKKKEESASKYNLYKNSRTEKVNDQLQVQLEGKRGRSRFN